MAIMAGPWRHQQQRRRIRRRRQMRLKEQRQNKLRNQCSGRDAPTLKQLVLLSAIAEAHKLLGMAPTLRELQEALGLRSFSTVLDRLGVLEDKGWVTRQDGTARAVELTELGWLALMRHPMQQWQAQRRVETAQLELVFAEEKERNGQERKKQEERHKLRQCMLPGFCGAGAVA